jgi:hypothetical protein
MIGKPAPHALFQQLVEIARQRDLLTLLPALDLASCLAAARAIVSRLELMTDALLTRKAAADAIARRLKALVSTRREWSDEELNAALATLQPLVLSLEMEGRIRAWRARKQIRADYLARPKKAGARSEVRDT